MLNNWYCVNIYGIVHQNDKKTLKLLNTQDENSKYHDFGMFEQ